MQKHQAIGSSPGQLPNAHSPAESLPLLGMRAQAVWGFTFTLAAFVIRACQGDFAFPSWWAALGALLGLIRSPL